MNYVILCTLMHTGTNFFTKLFTDAGYVKIGPNASKEQLLSPSGGAGWFTRCHVSPDALRLCSQYQKQGAVIVTTLRDPDEIEASWKARNRTEDFNEYMRLHHELLVLKPYVLSIDQAVDRQRLWDEFLEATRLPLTPTPPWGLVVNPGPHKR